MPPLPTWASPIGGQLTRPQGKGRQHLSQIRHPFSYESNFQPRLTVTEFIQFTKLRYTLSNLFFQQLFKNNDVWAEEIVHLKKYLPHRKEDLVWSSASILKKKIVVCACNHSAKEMERNKILGLACQSVLPNQASGQNESSCLKAKVDSTLRNDTSGCHLPWPP